METAISIFTGRNILPGGKVLYLTKCEEER
jgi:hypothetical protein